MKSSIKIDFQDTSGKGLEPVILVKLVDSDDVRDGLLKTFFQKLGGESSWLSVSFPHHIIDGDENHTTFIQVFPVSPSELKETVDLINGRLNSDQKVANFNSTLEHKGNYSLT